MSSKQTKNPTHPKHIPISQITDEENNDLVALWSLFCSRLKFIMLAVVIGAVVFGAGTYFLIAPKYTATSKIYIVSASNGSVINLSDLQIGSNLTSDFSELIKSRPMMESTIQNLGLDVSSEELSKMIEITNPAGTRILKIAATHTNPITAERIANEVARLSIDWLAAVMESNEPHIVEDAVVPTSKSSPNYLKNTVVGALLFGAVYFGICVFRYLMNDAISTEEEMERRFGMIPLAAIPEDQNLNASKEAADSPKKGKQKRDR